MPPPPHVLPDPSMDPSIDPGTDPATGPAPKFDIDKVDQKTAVYMGPELGPFSCGGCIHFEDPSSCNIVSGVVEADGCCNLYESAGNQGSPQDPDQDQGQESPSEDVGEPPEQVGQA